MPMTRLLALAAAGISSIVPSFCTPPRPSSSCIWLADHDRQMQLYIPDLGYDCPVYVGGQDVLDQGAVADMGVGWLPVAWMQPGTMGTLWMGGHRTTYGGPFQTLPDIAIGAWIYVQGWSSDGSINIVATYQVVGKTVADAYDHNEIWRADRNQGHPRLTLQTSAPEYGPASRWLVYADLVARYP